jgi:hypothetical protein
MKNGPDDILVAPFRCQRSVVSKETFGAVGKKIRKRNRKMQWISDGLISIDDIVKLFQQFTEGNIVICLKLNIWHNVFITIKLFRLIQNEYHHVPR